MGNGVGTGYGTDYGPISDSKKEDELLTQAIEYVSNETGYYKTDLWSTLAVGDLNPDNISIETYVKMMSEDAQVGAGSTLFKLALLSRPWDIKFPEGQEPENAQEIIDFLKWVFDNVNRTVHFRGGLRAFLEELIEGPMLGFAVAEPVYAREQYQGTTKAIIRKLKVLPQESITFHSDNFGDLIKIIQWAAGEEINLTPLSKFIVWSFSMRAGNWYGRPLLKRAYKHWYIKEFLIKEWNIFLERKAVPMFVGTTRPGNMKNLDKLLAKTNVKSSLVVTHGDEIDVVQSKAISSQFEMAIKYHDVMIFRGMLTPTLLLGQEDVGARALGDTHFQVFMWVVDKMKEDMTAIMDNLLIGLTTMNFAGVEVMPEFVVPEISTDDRDRFSKVVKDMVEAGVLDPTEDWIRKQLGFPLNPEWEGPISEIQDDNSPGRSPEGEQEGINADKSSPAAKQAVAMTNADQSANLNTKIQKEKMKSFMDIAENIGYSQLKLYIDDYEDVFKAQALELLEGYSPDDPNRFDYLAKLQKLKRPKDKPVAKILINVNEGYATRVANYYNQKLGLAEGKESGVKQDEFDISDTDTQKVITERAFTSSGVINDALLVMGKTALINGIRSGLTIEDMMADLETTFPDFSENRLRTIVRTNVVAASNQAILEVMRDTAGFVQGVMYQAILDDRTTDFCERHNGETLPVNDPRVDELSPPNHFQCRSYWVPVTINDTATTINTWAGGGPQPQKGFGTNPEGGS